MMLQAAVPAAPQAVCVGLFDVIIHYPIEGAGKDAIFIQN
jgi:hypothetical protein